MRWLLVVVVGSACYAPRLQTGSPCDDTHPCASPLTCAGTGTCEHAAIDAPVTDPETDAMPVDAVLVDGCSPSDFDSCGDGIDQDCDGSDPACAANDGPDAPVDVTGGGTFTADLLLATDDLPQVGCGNRGGRELYYRVTLGAPQVYYVDTFGSSFNTTVRVFPGMSCAALGGATGGTCNDDACNSDTSQLAVSLPTGTSCLVVDQDAAATTGSLTMTVVKGGRDGLPLTSSVTGNTCNSTNVWEPTNQCNGANSNGSKDLGYWFMACPGQTRRVSASTCSSATSYNFDTVLYVRKAGVTADAACVDDSESCPPRSNRPDYADGSTLTNVGVSGPGLGWVVVDGYDSGHCGTFTLTNLLQ